MRAKFRVQGVTFRGDHTNPDTPREYELTAVYDTSTPENERFTKATPWGNLKMTVNNPDARLDVGEEYYLDFTTCKAAANPEDMGNTHDIPDGARYQPAHAEDTASER